MADWDRMKASLFALVRAALPRVDYYAMYRGKVVTWHEADQTVDITPNDAKIPTMSGVPFRHGLPGVTARIGTGTSVLVGWENGDPQFPFACLWSGGESVARLTMNVGALYLGGETGAEPAIKGQTRNQAEATFLAALTTYIGVIQPIADPTGLGSTTMLNAITALQQAASTWLATNVQVK